MAGNGEGRDALGMEDDKLIELHPEAEPDIRNPSESDAKSRVVEGHPAPHFKGEDRELEPNKCSTYHRKNRRQSTISQELELLTKSWEQRSCPQPEETEPEDGHHAKDIDDHASRGASGRSGRVPEPAVPSQASQKLAESNKLEDQINLQHLVELMRIFHVRKL